MVADVTLWDVIKTLLSLVSTGGAAWLGVSLSLRKERRARGLERRVGWYEDVAAAITAYADGVDEFVAFERWRLDPSSVPFEMKLDELPKREAGGEPFDALERRGDLSLRARRRAFRLQKALTRRLSSARYYATFRGRVAADRLSEALMEARIPLTITRPDDKTYSWQQADWLLEHTSLARKSLDEIAQEMRTHLGLEEARPPKRADLEAAP